MVLLVVAGVHVRTLMHIELADLGYRVEDLVVLNVGRWDPGPRLRENNEAARNERGARARTLERRRNADNGAHTTLAKPAAGACNSESRATLRDLHLPPVQRGKGYVHLHRPPSEV